MTPTGGILYPRLSVVAIAVATVGAVLALRLGYLGTVGAKGLPVEVPRADLAPQRGSLWDRHGELLATERYVYDAALAPREVDDPDAFARTVAPALALAEADVRQAAGDVSQVWVPLAAAVPAATARALDDLSLPGLHLAREPRRAYPLDVAAAHVTGFVDASGKAFYGVEEHHDDALRGAPGSLVGPYGSDPRAYRAPVDGTSLVLTIDRELQAVASTTLAEAVAHQQATGGSIVILEPATGALLASASWPSFDPNDVGGADPATFPDPAVSAIYEPGSVLKSVTIAAGGNAIEGHSRLDILTFRTGSFFWS